MNLKKMFLPVSVLLIVLIATGGVYEYQKQMIPKIKEFKVTKNGATIVYPVATVDNTKAGQCLVKYNPCTTDPNSKSCYPYARVARIKAITFDTYMLSYYPGDPDKKKIGQIAEVPRHFVEAVASTDPQEYFTIQDCFSLTLENAPKMIPADNADETSKN
jgi:hypothetical protein